jgi:hypothetical protein
MSDRSPGHRDSRSSDCCRVGGLAGCLGRRGDVPAPESNAQTTETWEQVDESEGIAFEQSFGPVTIRDVLLAGGGYPTQRLTSVFEDALPPDARPVEEQIDHDVLDADPETFEDDVRDLVRSVQ